MRMWVKWLSLYELVALLEHGKKIDTLHICILLKRFGIAAWEGLDLDIV